MYRKKICYACILLFAIFLNSCDKQGDEQTKNDEASIRKAADLYVKAFNEKNSEALASMWTEDAEYINPETGEILKGRSALQEQFHKRFSGNKQGELKIEIAAIAFPKDGEAVETGTATITRPGEEPFKTIYRVTYKNIDGKWLLSKMNEVETFDHQSQYEHLKELDWLIGDWIDEDSDSTIETKTKWDQYKNFITQRFTVTIEGIVDLDGFQIIGWDPIEERVRSWVFDSNGGFGEGIWRKEGSDWVVETNSTLADGRKASSVNKYSPVDKDSYKWTSTGREVGGELLPDIDPVTVTRKKAL